MVVITITDKRLIVDLDIILQLGICFKVKKLNIKNKKWKNNWVQQHYIIIIKIYDFFHYFDIYHIEVF